MRSQRCITTCIWCSIRHTVTPPAAMASISAIKPRVCSALMPADGSSRSSNRGRATSASAMARRFCCSCVRLRACRSARSASPTTASVSRAAASASRSSRASRPLRISASHSPAFVRCRYPTSTLSSAVASANNVVAWKVRARPRRAISCACNPVTSCPSNVMRPLVAGSARLIRLKKVVLPAPLGPMIPVIDPAATVKSTSSTARKPPKDLLSRCASSSITCSSQGSRA